jgi:hypothetical protein
VRLTPGLIDAHDAPFRIDHGKARRQRIEDGIRQVGIVGLGHQFIVPGSAASWNLPAVVIGLCAQCLTR